MRAPITCRQLTEDDWALVSALRIEALQDSPRFFGSTLEREGQFTPQEWRNWIKGVEKIMFGLFDGQTCVGITGVLKDPDVAEAGLMVSSYIKPAYRGRGLADVFYKSRFEWAEGFLPWKKLIIHIRDGNEASKRACERNGFILEKTSPRKWPDGTVSDELSYVFDLEVLRRKKLDMKRSVQPHQENNRN